MKAGSSKVHIFWEGQNFLRNRHLTFDWHYLHRTKVRWRFRKILWPSQNIWTLKVYSSYLSNCQFTKMESSWKGHFQILRFKAFYVCIHLNQKILLAFILIPFSVLKWDECLSVHLPFEVLVQIPGQLLLELKAEYKGWSTL